MTADRIAALGYLIERKDAKQVNFGWAYGIGPYGLQDTIEKASGSRPDYDDCLAWLKGYGKAYPDANRWKWRVIDYAKELGYVRTIAGRRRHLPEINSSVKSLASSAGRQAVNSIIQGSAADVINWAMLRGAEIQGRYGARMLAQVHDEIVWEVPEENAQEFALEAQKVMQSAGDHFMVRIPLLAEPGIGPHWADAK
jgi:DNA polymerase-1